MEIFAYRFWKTQCSFNVVLCVNGYYYLETPKKQFDKQLTCNELGIYGDAGGLRSSLHSL